MLASILQSALGHLFNIVFYVKNPPKIIFFKWFAVPEKTIVGFVTSMAILSASTYLVYVVIYFLKLSRVRRYDRASSEGRNGLLKTSRRKRYSDR